MHIDSKRLLTALLVIVGTLAATWLGGTIGFLQGYAYAAGDTGARASYLTTALKALRKDQPRVALAFLETELDSMIVANAGIHAEGKPLFAGLAYRLMDLGRADPRLFTTVAAYRSAYPSLSERADVRATVESHLSAMQTEFARSAR